MLPASLRSGVFALPGLGVRLRPESVIGFARNGRSIRPEYAVRAHLVQKRYEKGRSVPDAQMSTLQLIKDPTLPKWNYTLRPT